MDMKALKHAVIAFWMVVGAAATLDASGGVVEIVLRGHYFKPTDTVRIDVIVEPSDQNRELQIEIDGARMFRASTRPLEGAREKRIHYMECDGLPQGQYEITATVYGPRGRRDSVTVSITVGH